MLNEILTRNAYKMLDSSVHKCRIRTQTNKQTHFVSKPMEYILCTLFQRFTFALFAFCSICQWNYAFTPYRCTYVFFIVLFGWSKGGYGVWDGCYVVSSCLLIQHSHIFIVKKIWIPLLSSQSPSVFYAAAHSLPLWLSAALHLSASEPFSSHCSCIAIDSLCAVLLCCVHGEVVCCRCFCVGWMKWQNGMMCAHKG